MNAYKEVKQLTEKYIKELKKIENLNDYEVILNIEPLVKLQIKEVSGFIDQKEYLKNVESQDFIMIRQPNGDIYNYRGKLTMTVK